MPEVLAPRAVNPLSAGSAPSIRARVAALYSTIVILAARAGARSTITLATSRQAPAPSRELQGLAHASLRVERRSGRVKELRNSMVGAGGMGVR